MGERSNFSPYLSNQRKKGKTCRSNFKKLQNSRKRPDLSRFARRFPRVEHGTNGEESLLNGKRPRERSNWKEPHGERSLPPSLTGTNRLSNHNRNRVRMTRSIVAIVMVCFLAASAVIHPSSRTIATGILNNHDVEACASRIKIFNHSRQRHHPNGHGTAAFPHLFCCLGP